MIVSSNLILLIFFIVIVLPGCSPLCNNQIQSEVMSPDLTRRASIFFRDCGATTGYSQQISVLGAKQPLPNRPGNVLILSGKSNIDVEWIDSRTLVIRYFSDDKNKQQKRLRGVNIFYEMP